jgi:hypothetical protein
MRELATGQTARQRHTRLLQRTHERPISELKIRWREHRLTSCFALSPKQREIAHPPHSVAINHLRQQTSPTPVNNSVKRRTSLRATMQVPTRRPRINTRLHDLNGHHSPQPPRQTCVSDLRRQRLLERPRTRKYQRRRTTTSNTTISAISTVHNST